MPYGMMHNMPVSHINTIHHERMDIINETTRIPRKFRGSA
jgi:hypothetical protein